MGKGTDPFYPDHLVHWVRTPIAIIQHCVTQSRDPIDHYVIDRINDEKSGIRFAQVLTQVRTIADREGIVVHQVFFVDAIRCVPVENTLTIVPDVRGVLPL